MAGGSDTFSGALDPHWVLAPAGSGTMSTSGGKVVADGPCTYYRDDYGSTGDVFISAIEGAATPTDRQLGVALRFDNSDLLYVVRNYLGDIALEYNGTPVGTQVGTQPAPYVAGEIGLRYTQTTGARVEALFNGVPIWDTGSSPPSSVHLTPALVCRVFDANAALESVAWGDLVLPATAVVWDGPTSGTVGVAATGFTATLNGSVSSPVTVTPGAPSGSFSPTSAAISTGETANFSYTAASAGVKSLTIANSAGLTNDDPISFTAAAAGVAPTFDGPDIANISVVAGQGITPVDVSGKFSTGGTPAYSASPAGAAWPSGLVIGASSGIISGTPAANATGIKVRKANGTSPPADSNAFDVTRTPPPNTRPRKKIIALAATGQFLPGSLSAAAFLSASMGAPQVLLRGSQLLPYTNDRTGVSYPRLQFLYDDAQSGDVALVYPGSWTIDNAVADVGSPYIAGFGIMLNTFTVKWEAPGQRPFINMKPTVEANSGLEVFVMGINCRDLTIQGINMPGWWHPDNGGSNFLATKVGYGDPAMPNGPAGIWRVLDCITNDWSNGIQTNPNHNLKGRIYRSAIFDCGVTYLQHGVYISSNEELDIYGSAFFDTVASKRGGSPMLEIGNLAKSRAKKNIVRASYFYCNWGHARCFEADNGGEFIETGNIWLRGPNESYAKDNQIIAFGLAQNGAQPANQRFDMEPHSIFSAQSTYRKIQADGSAARHQILLVATVRNDADTGTATVTRTVRNNIVASGLVSTLDDGVAADEYIAAYPGNTKVGVLTIDDNGVYSGGVIPGTATDALYAYAGQNLEPDPRNDTNMGGRIVGGGSSAVAPSITTQPSAQWALAGSTASFSIAVAGTPTPTVQWKRNGTNVGTNSTSYTTGTLTEADSGASFTAVVTNASGTVTSSAAVLTVAAAGEAWVAPPGSPAWMQGDKVAWNVYTVPSSIMSGIMKDDGTGVTYDGDTFPTAQPGVGGFSGETYAGVDANGGPTYNDITGELAWNGGGHNATSLDPLLVLQMDYDVPRPRLGSPVTPQATRASEYGRSDWNDRPYLDLGGGRWVPKMPHTYRNFQYLATAYGGAGAWVHAMLSACDAGPHTEDLAAYRVTAAFPRANAVFNGGNGWWAPPRGTDVTPPAGSWPDPPTSAGEEASSQFGNEALCATPQDGSFLLQGRYNGPLRKLDGATMTWTQVTAGVLDWNSYSRGAVSGNSNERFFWMSGNYVGDWYGRVVTLSTGVSAAVTFSGLARGDRPAIMGVEWLGFLDRYAVMFEDGGSFSIAQAIPSNGAHTAMALVHQPLVGSTPGNANLRRSLYYSPKRRVLFVYRGLTNPILWIPVA